MFSGINGLQAMSAAYTRFVLDDATIARRLDVIRERLIANRGEMSQRKLEKKSGVDQPTISRIEAGTAPDLATLMRLVDGLGRTLADFFADVERPTNNSLKRVEGVGQNLGSSTSGAETDAPPAVSSSAAILGPLLAEFKASTISEVNLQRLAKRVAALERSLAKSLEQGASRRADRPGRSRDRAHKTRKSA